MIDSHRLRNYYPVKMQGSASNLREHLNKEGLDFLRDIVRVKKRIESSLFLLKINAQYRQSIYFIFQFRYW